MHLQYLIPISYNKSTYLTFLSSIAKQNISGLASDSAQIAYGHQTHYSINTNNTVIIKLTLFTPRFLTKC